ncbi:MAG TPA: hypothetical protein DCM14_01300 [Clostridiales bacterium UBA8153]|nr:hypothetical protein [Clostridiales bacterium UBA8153]
MGIVLEDARHWDDGNHHRADLVLILQSLMPVDYCRTIALPGDVRARLHHAGHILGGPPLNWWGRLVSSFAVP